jgi:dTDP-4-dehydrorhamnose reductase
MQKILITGANGFVGQVLAGRVRQSQDFHLLATSASESLQGSGGTGDFQRMDITSQEQVSTVIGSFHPDVIVHCAAMTQVDPCEQEPERCDRVNIEGTRQVAKAAERIGARFVFLSTDFVFDGLKGPYQEDDQPNPVSTYGWSKLQGEFITQSLRTPWAIVRTILVYGVAPSMSRGNLVTWVRSSLLNGTPIRVVDDQFRMPTLVDDLAEGIIRIIRLQKEGTYHLSGPERVSVYDFARMTGRFFGLDASLITPVKSAELNQPGRRPPSTGFILDKAKDDLNYSPVSLLEGLDLVRNLLNDSAVDNR